ncbi:hypothetical protein HW132_27285 [Brasilonema sp. CT11]|nr:hypothetical protein [Brasilonema sp. CT11]
MTLLRIGERKYVVNSCDYIRLAVSVLVVVFRMYEKNWQQLVLVESFESTVSEVEPLTLSVAEGSNKIQYREIVEDNSC